MSLAKRLPNMSSNTTRMRVLDMLPTAYWVNGDTGMKQTSQMAWDNVYLTAAELAVIVPIPDSVRDDASVDLYGEIKPRVIEAISQCVDAATFFGVNRPAEWQNDIVTLARQAGNNIPATVVRLYAQRRDRVYGNALQAARTARHHRPAHFQERYAGRDSLFP